MWCKRTGHDGVKQYTLCCQSCPSFPLEILSCIGYPEERRELKQQSFLRVKKRPQNRYTLELVAQDPAYISLFTIRRHHMAYMAFATFYMLVTIVLSCLAGFLVYRIRGRSLALVAAFWTFAVLFVTLAGFFIPSTWVWNM